MDRHHRSVAVVRLGPRDRRQLFDATNRAEDRRPQRGGWGLARRLRERDRARLQPGVLPRQRWIRGEQALERSILVVGERARRAQREQIHDIVASLV
jgi:hypothetical protein